MRTSFTILAAAVALAVTLPSAATDHARASSVAVVCNPSWGTITIPICL